MSVNPSTIIPKVISSIKNFYSSDMVSKCMINGGIVGAIAGSSYSGYITSMQERDGVSYKGNIFLNPFIGATFGVIAGASLPYSVPLIGASTLPGYLTYRYIKNRK